MAPVYARPSDLPVTVPVFPLPGALLLPGAQLPLNVFEPRYIAMVDDALRDHRVIAMIQPASEAESLEPAPKLADVGCLGRLTQLLETGDGRYLITLTGLIRFRRLSESVGLTPYRRCLVSYRDFESDFTPDLGEERVDRGALMAAFRAFADSKGLAVDWDSVDSAPTGALVNALSAMSPFGVLEKQALLEARDLAQRAQILVALARMELAQSGATGVLQ